MNGFKYVCLFLMLFVCAKGFAEKAWKSDAKSSAIAEYEKAILQERWNINSCSIESYSFSSPIGVDLQLEVQGVEDGLL